MKSNKVESRLPESKPAFLYPIEYGLQVPRSPDRMWGILRERSMLYDLHEKTAEHRALCRGTIYRAEEYV